MDFLAAFQNTHQPVDDLDVAETTGHLRAWREELDPLASWAVTGLRHIARSMDTLMTRHLGALDQTEASA